MNAMKTAFLLGLLSALIVGIGSLVAGSRGMIVALVIVLGSGSGPAIDDAVALAQRTGAFVESYNHPAIRYGTTDVDGSRPDAWGYIRDHGFGDKRADLIRDYR